MCVLQFTMQFSMVYTLRPHRFIPEHSPEIIIELDAPNGNSRFYTGLYGNSARIYFILSLFTIAVTIATEIFTDHFSRAIYRKRDHGTLGTVVHRYSAARRVADWIVSIRRFEQSTRNKVKLMRVSNLIKIKVSSNNDNGYSSTIVFVYIDVLSS